MRQKTLFSRRIIETTRYIVKELEEVDGIYIMGVPDVSVIAIGTLKFGSDIRLAG